VPAEWAVLAGTVETAVNALWDAAPLIGDRIAVVGGGMVGCSVAALLARIPGVRLQLVDADPARAKTAEGSARASPHLPMRSATAISWCTPALPRRVSPVPWNCCGPRARWWN
jgi:threonine dehydrogenase-like Zn-dependent dehydrogenase